MATTQTAVIHAVTAPLQVLSLFISAILHDFKHPGVTNAYLIEVQHALALQYNDVSVLESFHASEGLRLLMREDMNFLTDLLSCLFFASVVGVGVGVGVVVSE